MAVYATMVQEETATTGIGPLTLTGATTDHRALIDVFTPNVVDLTADYVAYHLEASDGTWERGYGKFYNATTLNRTYVIESTNSNALIILPSGTHTLSVAPSPDMVQPGGALLETINNTPLPTATWRSLDWAAVRFDSEAVITVPTVSIAIPFWVDLLKMTLNIEFQTLTATGYRKAYINSSKGIPNGAPDLSEDASALHVTRLYTQSGIIRTEDFLVQNTGQLDVYCIAYQNSGADCVVEGTLQIEYVR